MLRLIVSHITELAFSNVIHFKGILSYLIWIRLCVLGVLRVSHFYLIKAE
jgi:hypothetical protein